VSEKTRLPLAEASKLAEEVKAILSPFCQRIEIAGSIRRGSVFCGDIEIVAVPTPIEDACGLFGETVRIQTNNAVYKFLDGDERFELRLNVNGQRSFGPLMMLLTYKDFALDVFCCEPEQWGVTMVVRTGNANYSKAFVTQTHLGGKFLREGMKVEGWRLWRDGLIYETPEEEDVFSACGQNWQEPGERV